MCRMHLDTAETEPLCRARCVRKVTRQAENFAAAKCGAAR